MNKVSARPIINVNYGLASSYNDGIEINHKLVGDLRKKIIEHELRHSSGVYTKQDFKNDFQSKSSYFFESLKFSLRNAEAFINFFPIMYSYYYKIFTVNISALFPFLQFGAIFSVLFWLLFRISIIKSFLTFTIFIVLANIFLLIYTHIYVVRDKGFQYSEELNYSKI